jgi:hypothetical protein
MIISAHHSSQVRLFCLAGGGEGLQRGCRDRTYPPSLAQRRPTARFGGTTRVWCSEPVNPGAAGLHADAHAPDALHLPLCQEAMLRTCSRRQ